MADRSLNIRTPAENLWLWRRRQDFTKAQAATALCISEYRYSLLESGEGKPKRRITPTPGDLCALARRRYGLELRGTAELLKMSHVTLLAMERRSDAVLIAEWMKLGYKFR